MKKQGAPKNNQNARKYPPGQRRHGWGGCDWRDDELYIRDAIKASLKAQGLSTKEFWLRWFQELEKNN